MTNMFSILAPGHINFSETVVFCYILVATVREMSGKNKNFSRSGKSQGIFKKVGENLWYCQTQ